MGTSAISLEDATRSAEASDGERLRYLWLGLGAFALLFCGGGWDIPLAPWLASVVLMRFARTSRLRSGIAWVWLASIAGVFAWSAQYDAPMIPFVVIGAVVFGTAFTLPYLLDRIFASKLSNVGRLMLFPASYAAFEFLIGTFSPTGTSFSLRAVTQYDNLPLLQVISVTGPYAIAFLMGWFATAVNSLWEQPTSRDARIAAAVFAASLVVISIGGSLRLAFFPPLDPYVRVAGIAPSGATLRAAQRLFGGALPSATQDLERADPQNLQAAYTIITQGLFADTRQAARAGAKIVAWSETAANVVGPEKAALLAEASAVAREENIYLDIGVGIPSALNETYLFGPTGELLWQYNKRHPVPGMEFVPPGNSPVPFAETPFGRLANVICFDGDFPAHMRQKADIMLVPAYDWGGVGLIHTMRMTRLRTIENGYSMLRADRDGLTGTFDHQGRLLARQDTTTNTEHVMLADLPTQGVSTIYRRIGDAFGWLCLLGTLSLVGIGLIKQRSAKRSVR